jgi:hypothetical protein
MTSSNTYWRRTRTRTRTKNNKKSEEEDQQQEHVLTDCKNEERRPSRNVFANIWLAGIAAGLVLQVVTAFSALLTIFKVWGRDPQPQDLSNRAIYYILFLLRLAYVTVLFLINKMFIFSIARTGPMYRRNKFDHDDSGTFGLLFCRNSRQYWDLNAEIESLGGFLGNETTMHKIRFY